MGDRMTTIDDLARVERELRSESARNHGHGFYEYAKGVEGWANTIAAYIAAQSWRPIETAPRDGSWFLVWNGNWVGVAKYREPYDDTDPCPSWEDESGHFITPQPTIWQPLPEPPNTKAEGFKENSDG